MQVLQLLMKQSIKGHLLWPVFIIQYPQFCSLA